MKLLVGCFFFLVTMFIVWEGNNPQYPAQQEFEYETSLWNWQTTLEIIQAPLVEEVVIEVTINGNWWIGVETLDPNNHHGRLTYKSSVAANILGNSVEDGTRLVCELNGPFDGRFDFTGTSGRVGRDMFEDGVTRAFSVDPTNFIGKDKYYMPIVGFTDHEIIEQGNAFNLAFFEEKTRLRIKIWYNRG
jgi:hypothetical protein